MKTSIITLLFWLIAAANCCFAQDTIVKRNGDEVSAQVLEVSPQEVRYREFGKPDGPIYILQRADVFMIRYQNGSKDVFNEPASTAPPRTQTPSNIPQPAPGAGTGAGQWSSANSQEMYMRGMSEARAYYKGRGPMWGTFGATLAFAPAGLVVGIITAAVPPSLENQDVSDRALLNNNDFRAGYKKQAHRRKLGKAATGFGIGIGVLVLLNIVING